MFDSIKKYLVDRGTVPPYTPGTRLVRKVDGRTATLIGQCKCTCPYEHYKVWLEGATRYKVFQHTAIEEEFLIMGKQSVL